jgi:23S rRNA pseudouridine1911/1915/1917 synthase
MIALTLEPTIIHEDKQLLVVLKPPGWLSQADGSGRPDLLSWSKKEVKLKWNKPGNVFMGLTHRLDLPVGGLMVLAKTSKAASRISQQFRERTTQKKYLALGSGTPSLTSGALDGALTRVGRKTVAAPQASPGGARASLNWKLLRKGVLKLGPASLIEVELLTGVKHQIRCQLAGIGLPLWGDALYGGPAPPPGAAAIGLFASALSFNHPISQERLDFTASPGDYWPWGEWKKENGPFR